MKLSLFFVRRLRTRPSQSTPLRNAGPLQTNKSPKRPFKTL